MGENIAKRRMELGFTQEKAAELIGVSRQSYSRIERGKTRLVSKKLSKIADAFHCDENLVKESGSVLENNRRTGVTTA